MTPLIVRAARLLEGRAQIRNLFATWTDDQRRKVLDHATSNGGTYVDDKVVGDFNLSLWYVDIDQGPLAGRLYIVALNSGNFNPFDTNEIMKDRTKPETQKGLLPTNQITGILNVLKDWCSAYGQLMIASSNMRKFGVYEKVLRKFAGNLGFKFKPVIEGQPEVGIFLSLGP